MIVMPKRVMMMMVTLSGFQWHGAMKRECALAVFFSFPFENRVTNPAREKAVANRIGLVAMMLKLFIFIPPVQHDTVQRHVAPKLKTSRLRHATKPGFSFLR